LFLFKTIKSSDSRESQWWLDTPPLTLTKSIISIYHFKKKQYLFLSIKVDIIKST